MPPLQEAWVWSLMGGLRCSMLWYSQKAENETTTTKIRCCIPQSLHISLDLYLLALKCPSRHHQIPRPSGRFFLFWGGSTTISPARASFFSSMIPEKYPANPTLTAPNTLHILLLFKDRLFKKNWSIIDVYNIMLVSGVQHRDLKNTLWNYPHSNFSKQHTAF